MEFSGIRDFRNKSAASWKKLNKEKELVVTSNGKPVAVLSAVTPANVEQSLRLSRQARAMIAVNTMRRQAVTNSLDRASLEEINKIILETRKQHHGKQ